MAVEIVIPSLGESITEVRLGRWHRVEGDWVEKDEILVEIESDKVTQEFPSPAAGVLHVTEEEGTDLPVGAVIGSVDTEAERPAQADPAPAEPSATASEPVSTPAARVEDATEAASPVRVTPLARKVAEDRGVDIASVPGTGLHGKITKSDVLSATDVPASAAPIIAGDGVLQRGERRTRMSKLRQRIAERLVHAQRTAAMLTTFNEADMSHVIALRNAHKEEFNDRFGVKLGFMSFFIRAAVSALHKYPLVNAFIEGDEVVEHDYVDMSVAVGTDKGLVVPVIRNADRRSFSEIETTIMDLAAKAREGRLGIDDMTGGTFTISNGGVYGSMMSTPILNPPQSGILGLHRIQNRPIEDPDNPGQIALRPMMYLALSYDHRIVDGAEAVGFLVHLKQCIEHPERLLLDM
ncbi:MAG: 2-oxoglutarate dehydrogenase complex dihydrolipoyllysine-residue succinyltransferase [Planctomycetota bacterium]|nr:2-oxoglutarate dehydrogenase complex dihydrolipoyllysine-residue succinyltransferase [Planctomycetota bacterium]